MHTATQRQRPDIQIDTKHCRAICDEIGWRLRQALMADYATLPDALAILLDRLIDTDLAIDAPSLIPAMSNTPAPSNLSLESTVA